MFKDLKEIVKDEDGFSGYELNSDGSVELFITDNKGTYYIRFHSFDNMHRIFLGIKRIVDVSELHSQTM